MQTEVTPTPRTLPAALLHYTDPQIFAEEMDRFYSQMVGVCRPATPKFPAPAISFCAKLAGESIIVTRDASARVHAFFNVCRQSRHPHLLPFRGPF